MCLTCEFVTLLCVFVCICVHGSHERAKPNFQPPGRKGTFPCKKSLVKTKKDNNGLLVYIQRRAFPLGPQKHTQLCPSDNSTFFFHAGLPCGEPLWTLQRMYSPWPIRLVQALQTLHRMQLLQYGKKESIKLLRWTALLNCTNSALIKLFGTWTFWL